MSKNRKSNGKRVGSKPKKAVASKPARKNVTHAKAIVPNSKVEPIVAVAAAEQSEAPPAVTAFQLWTRAPFALMDIWFSKFRREDKRTGA